MKFLHIFCIIFCWNIPLSAPTPRNRVIKNREVADATPWFQRRDTMEGACCGQCRGLLLMLEPGIALYSQNESLLSLGLGKVPSHNRAAVNIGNLTHLTNCCMWLVSELLAHTSSPPPATSPLPLVTCMEKCKVL